MLSRTFKKRFAVAVRRMLRPVIRRLIAYGITYPALDEMIRRVYVEVAERDFALPYKRQTDSRLALLTGLNRKEVAQLRRREEDEGELTGLEASPVTHVIGRWLSGPPFASPDGMPRRLPYESDEPAPSFTTLVKKLGVDIPVRAILDELIRIGAAELTPDGEVELHLAAHLAGDNVEGKIALIGSDPGELFSTIAHNIEAPESPWFQRKVLYDNIGADALPQLEEEVRRLGEEFVRRGNALLASYDRDRNPDAPGGPRTRVSLGAYYYEEDTDRRPRLPENVPGTPPGRIRRSK